MNSPRPLSPLLAPTLLAASSIPAGFPSPCTDHAVEAIDLNDYLYLNKASTYLFRVSGDSMIGTSIHDGDTLIVDRAVAPLHGHIVVASVDGDWTVKRLDLKNKPIRLLPENERFKPIEFKDDQELTIFGVVTWNLHRLMRT